MSTSYGWEGLRQCDAALMHATYLSASVVALSILSGTITNILLNLYLFASGTF